MRTGHSPRSILEQYVRSTGAVWNTINEKDVQIPSDPKRYPPGVQPPPPSRHSTRMFSAGTVRSFRASDLGSDLLVNED